MSRRAVWRERPRAAFTARALVIAVPASLGAGGAALVAWALADGAPRIAWALAVAVLALPATLIAWRARPWLRAWADLLDWRLEFGSEAPTRAHVAWMMRSQRAVASVVEQLHAERLGAGSESAARLVAVVAGLRHDNPEVVARLDRASPCAAALCSELALPEDERFLVDWLIALRFACDVVGRGELEQCVEGALEVVPGALLDVTRSHRAACVAAVACEFGVLAAPNPFGLGERPWEAREAILEAARGWMTHEVVEALARVPVWVFAPAGPPREPVTLRWRRPAIAMAAAVATIGVLAAVVAMVQEDGGEGDESEVLGVIEENRPPLARPDDAEVVVGGTVEIKLLANDSDPDGDALRLMRWDPPSLGVAVAVDGVLRYTARSPGTDRFRYVVADPAGAEAEAVVTVKVQASLD